MSETIDIEESEENFIAHSNQELVLSGRAVENLNTQIKQAKEQLNQLVGRYQAQTDSLETYMNVLRHKYNIPKEYRYSVEKGAFIDPSSVDVPATNDYVYEAEAGLVEGEEE